MENIIKMHEMRKKMKKDTFTIIYKHIWQTFVNKNMAGCTDNFLVYTVPTFIPGHVPYNINECCAWLKKKVEKKGKGIITITIIPPNNLYLIWKFD